MSFPPGVRLPMTRPLYSTMPSGAMMVQMAPVRPVTMVPVSQVVVRPVMRPVISQSQAAFVRTMQPQTLTQVVTNQAVLQAAGQQVWIQSAEPPKSAIISKPPELKKDLIEKTSQPQNVETSNEPAITVFVGNITDRASDTLVRQLLMKCGSVYAWKRVQGPSGKLQAFGFCEYKDPESALRAIHLLHDYALGDKKLLVKVDAKTQELIDNWKKEKGMDVDKNDFSKLPGVKEAMTGIEALVGGYSSELTVSKSSTVEKQEATTQVLKPDPAVRDSTNVEENLEELKLEEDKKNFISKEIRSFRESQKQQEARLKLFKAEREKIRSREIMLRERSRISRSDRNDYNRRARSPRNRRSRSISPIRRSPRRRSRSPSRGFLIRRVSPRRTPPRRRSRSPPPRRRRSTSRSPVWKREEEESEREEERRRVDRRIKEKEAAYQERLRNFETRERRQKRLYEKQKEQEVSEREEMAKQAKKLREFLADYDDDKQDGQFYFGSVLTKRLSDREVEVEEDKKERRKEAEELGLLRKRLMEENHTDPEAVIAKVLAETDKIWKPLLEPDTPPRSPPSPSPIASSPSSSSSGSDSNSDKSSSYSSSDSESSDNQSIVYETEIITTDLSNHNDTNNHVSTHRLDPDVKMERRSSSIGSPSSYSDASSPETANKYEIKQEHSTNARSTNANTKRRKLTVSDVFNQDDDDLKEDLPKKKKFLPLHLSNEDRKSSRDEEKKPTVDKKKLVRALIERIPTKKEELFRYEVDWSVIDSVLMEKRIKPWITKKIVEYIGENEPTLVEFICSKIQSKSSPTKILDDISMVLDEEAENFVAKMWRLVIYETEAKKEGLTKS